MSKPQLTYIVTLGDTLRVNVEVTAFSPEEAERKAIKQWSNDLWEKADPMLAGTPSEVIESYDRTVISVEEDFFQTTATKESTPCDRPSDNHQPGNLQTPSGPALRRECCQLGNHEPGRNGDVPH